MTLEGTVVNGVVVFDGAAKVPEGARVRVAFPESEPFEYPHPMAPYDREKEIALLKERYEVSRELGAKYYTLDEIRAEFAREFNLPE
jgi:hypothetical protein